LIAIATNCVPNTLGGYEPEPALLLVVRWLVRKLEATDYWANKP